MINFQLNSNGFQRFAWADKRSAWMMYRKPRERAQQIIFNWMNAHKNTHTHTRAREHTWEMSSRSVLACDECALRANYQTHDHQMCTLSVFYVCCVTNNLFCWAHCFFNLLFVCFFLFDFGFSVRFHQRVAFGSSVNVMRRKRENGACQWNQSSLQPNTIW